MYMTINARNVPADTAAVLVLTAIVAWLGSSKRHSLPPKPQGQSRDGS